MMVELLDGGRRVVIDGVEGKRIYRGNSRRVFITDEYVIKVEEVGDWLEQCRSEYLRWKRLPKKDRRWFVPILYYRRKKPFDVVVQPRMRFRRGRVSKWMQFQMNCVVEKYRLTDFAESHPCNWSVTVDGNPMIYDYGL